MLAGTLAPELGGHDPGGLSRHLWQLATALRSRGHHVQVLAIGKYFRFGNRTADHIEILGPRASLSSFMNAWRCWWRYVRTETASGGFRDKLYTMYQLYRFACVKDILDDADVIHVHGYYNKATLACELLGIRTAVVLTVHSYTPIVFLRADKQPARVALTNRLLRHVDTVIHVSRADRDRADKLGIRWTGGDRIVYNGMSCPPLPTDNGNRSGVCFVGLLNPRKGIGQLLEAYQFRRSALVEPLKIAGTGPMQQVVETAARRDNGIEVAGYLDQDGVRGLMGSSLALAVPSFSESFGLVYLEALLAGTPVVGYPKTLDEFRDVLQLDRQQSSYLVSYDMVHYDPKTLIDAIELAVSARLSDASGTIAAYIAERIREQFDWSFVIAKVESVYADTMRSRSLRNSPGRHHLPNRDSWRTTYET